MNGCRHDLIFEGNKLWGDECFSMIDIYDIIYTRANQHKPLTPTPGHDRSKARSLAAWVRQAHWRRCQKLKIFRLSCHTGSATPERCSGFSWPKCIHDHGCMAKHDQTTIQNIFRHDQNWYTCTLLVTWTIGHISSKRHGWSLNGFHLGFPVGRFALAHGYRDCRGWIAGSFHLPSIRTLTLYYFCAISWELTFKPTYHPQTQISVRPMGV